MKYLLASLCLLAASWQSQAALISVNANIFDNTVLFDYTIEITNPDTDVISVIFDATLFDNLQVVTNSFPSTWDLDPIQSANIFGFLDDGFVDFINIGSIGVGNVFSGFQISAELIGTLDNNSFEQAFDVFNIDFDLIDGGLNTVVVNPQTVSSPASFWALMLALTMLLFRKVSGR